ncbi:MAG TPA: histidine phosphatase family protein [Propionibacteriaceae bacterium]|jgi:glucosyl-3-phosphoglycerate phosphatase|nr:histidine phosphatase family protein [Propionibacteriaceae bacterium]
MTAARIIIWRHGRTEWNVIDRYQGQADIPLDEVGYAQAIQAAEVLAAYRPSRVYSSDLTRCYQTAEMLAQRVGLDITTDKRLREIHVGSWEGLLGEEIRAADPELARRLWAGEEVRRSPTGESPSEVAERMVEALTEIAEEAEDQSTVVVVTHGLAGRVGACKFVGLPFDEWRRLGGLSNCAWVSIGRHRSGAYWRIESYNVTAVSDIQRG